MLGDKVSGPKQQQAENPLRSITNNYINCQKVIGFEMSLAYKPISKEEVLRLVQVKGPVIPIHLKKDLQTDTILIGAVLSQLVDEGKVKVSAVKIGGSPTYYVPGSEEKLVELIRYLNEKDRRAAEMLRERKVMNDVEQDPLVRVCLRNIKDYAKPLEVSVKGSKEIYWKWFMTPTKEAEDIILKRVKPEGAKPVVKEEKQVQKPVVKEEPAPRPAEALRDEKPKKEAKKREKKEKPEPRHHEKQEKLPAEEQPRRTAATPNYFLDEEKDAFFNRVRPFLEEREIAILDYKVVRKGEIDLFILVPTKLGVQEYFCKAKDKKKLSDSDLSNAYLKGQAAKLPTILLSPGEPNKKAKELLSTQFRGMAVKKL